MLCGYEDRATGRSWFQVSRDRGHAWGPRQALPDFGLSGVQGRTDYLLSGQNDGLFLFVATSAWKPDEGREVLKCLAKFDSEEEHVQTLLKELAAKI